MRNRRLALILLPILVLALPVSGQQLPDPSAERIRLGESEVVSFVPGARREKTVAVAMGLRPQNEWPSPDDFAQTYFGLEDHYITPGGKRLTLLYGVFESKRDAADALRYIGGLRNGILPTDVADPVGDLAEGVSRSYVFVLDRGICGLEQSSVSENDAINLKPIALAVANKMAAAGMQAAPPFILQTTAVSDTAGPNSHVVLDCSAITDPSWQPVEFAVSITASIERLPLELYHFFKTEAPDGMCHFEWDGRDPEGFLVPPGQYLLSLSATDNLGRSKLVRVPITVAAGTPSSLTIPPSKDSTLRSADPHQNEGANPQLVLSHMPERRGRANNPIVAFDLSQVELAGLTRATLALDVRECSLPRFWGPDGRYLQAQRILSPWVEGNGKDLLLLPRHSSRGNGQGATWFSPIDNDISNTGPNGSEQWQGARLALAPPTAPSVLVVNGQTGVVEFDVTQDVLNGAAHGWLVRKQDESRFGNIRFSSKEGDSPPRLLLEYGSPQAHHSAGLAALTPARLVANPLGLEGQTTRRSALALMGGDVLTALLDGNPFAGAMFRLIRVTWQANLV
ncbi:MAG: hypothetical protein AB7S38_15730 [Vulcanimicrobiota bacterium]